jgi:two-component system response regulator
MIASRPLRILQVEDTASDVFLTALALNQTQIPHSIQVMPTGRQAIEFLKRGEGFEDGSRPDLILLDLSLPGVNGEEVLEFIKSTEALKAIPVVIFTTQDSDEIQLRAYQHCANSYVVKPLDLAKFTTAVQSVVSYWSQTSTLVPQRRPRE